MNNTKKPATAVTTLSVRLDSNDFATLVERSRLARRTLSDYVRWLLAHALEATREDTAVRNEMNALNPPADLETLDDFLNDAEGDAAGRAGDPYERTPLLNVFADAEWALIKELRELVTTDEDARQFVRRWRELVETTESDDYPQRRGAILARTDEATFVIGAQLLRCAVSLWDAFVADEIVKGYRVLGTVVEDSQHTRRSQCADVPPLL
jgi:hypothetical protein